MEKIIGPMKALSDETRVKILNLLLTHDYCVGALAGRLGVSEAAVSQHLQVLRKNGFVKGEKRGYWTHYAVEREALKKLAAALDELAARAGPARGCQKHATDPAAERRITMACECGCKKPESLKEKPEKCTQEQIEECHGQDGEHPCEEAKEDS